jgi:hypothetical protein
MKFNMRVLPIYIFLIIGLVASSAFGGAACYPIPKENAITEAVQVIELCNHWAGEVGGSSDPERIQEIAQGFERDCPRAAEIAKEAYKNFPDSPVLSAKILILIDFGYYEVSDAEKVQICFLAASRIMDESVDNWDTKPYFESFCSEQARKIDDE